MTWLKELRKTAKLSQKAVADLCGISQPFYNYIENGKRSPSVNTAQKIAKIFNFDWTKFYATAGGLNDENLYKAPFTDE